VEVEIVAAEVLVEAGSSAAAVEEEEEAD